MPRRSSSRYPAREYPTQRSANRFSGWKLRLLIGAVIVLFTVINYAMKGEINPVTGQHQRVGMSIDEEIRLGQQSVPEMGYPSFNRMAQQRVEQVGAELVDALDRHLAAKGIERPFPFAFHLLADQGRNRGSVNAFALPGGQVFVTEALYRLLDSSNNGQLAGVLGHEIGHVLERHGSEQMATGGLMQGLSGAAGVTGGSIESTRAASVVGNLITMKYGRGDELESDQWGVRLMVMAGYNPEHLIQVMDILEAAGGSGGPEFMSTHPRPENRREYIREIIQKTFPDGIPGDLR